MSNLFFPGAAMRPPVAACLQASTSFLTTSTQCPAGHLSTVGPRRASRIGLSFPAKLPGQGVRLAWDWKGTRKAFPVVSLLALRYVPGWTGTRIATARPDRIGYSQLAGLAPGLAWRTGNMEGGAS